MQSPVSLLRYQAAVKPEDSGSFQACVLQVDGATGNVSVLKNGESTPSEQFAAADMGKHAMRFDFDNNGKADMIVGFEQDAHGDSWCFKVELADVKYSSLLKERGFDSHGDHAHGDINSDGIPDGIAKGTSGQAVCHIQPMAQ